MAARDIIVIGASAGGFEAIQEVVAGFAADLRAAVFVTLHVHPQSDGILPYSLNRSGRLPAMHAEDGMSIEQGRIYVAPPDHHLVIQNGFMQLSHGPKENLHRPCINVMFRSAATAYGERVAGVVLTGLLDDGAAGLWEIQQHNGATVVQDPEEAAFRSMPDSAIRGLNVQYILCLREIAPLLTRLSSTHQSHDSHERVRAEVVPAGQVCPECGGVMTEAKLGRLSEFRCHVGHRFGVKSLIAQKSTYVERALYAALAQLEELVDVLRAGKPQLRPAELTAVDEEIQRRLEQQEHLRSMLENGRSAFPFG